MNETTRPSAEYDAPAPDDRWGYRAKRAAFLSTFATPGTAEAEHMEAALSDLTDALLHEARYHATWPVATAEKWRYDQMLWTFAIMLGEIPADTPAPPADCVNCGASGGNHESGCFVAKFEADTSTPPAMRTTTPAERPTGGDA